MSVQNFSNFGHLTLKNYFLLKLIDLFLNNSPLFISLVILLSMRFSCITIKALLLSASSA